MAPSRSPAVEAWLAALPPGRRQQALNLAELIHDADLGVAEAVKWGRLTFTLNHDWHHWVCAISNTKADLKLMFHKGALLPDPAGLLQGEGRYLRLVPYDTAVARAAPVTRLLQAAVARQTDMLDGPS